MSMPVICPSKTSRCQAVNDLMESIALEEAALSHILNAEGEKLQKFIASPCVTPDMLLCANESVRSTVAAVMRLEWLLHDKLEMAVNGLCEENCHPGCGYACGHPGGPKDAAVSANETAAQAAEEPEETEPEMH